MKKVKPLKTVPDAFAEIGRTVNELCEVAKPIKAGKGIKLTESNEDIMIATDADGLPAGYTFEAFTICDSGTPATRWWPTWTSNPEA